MVDWQIVTMIVLFVLLLLASGWIKRLTKEVKDVVDAFSAAIQDDEVTKEELNGIVKEARDVAGMVAELIWVVARKFNR